MARYGETAAAASVLDAMLDVSQSVDLHRLPELICGFHRRAEEGPTLYPVACAPQAWRPARSISSCNPPTRDGNDAGRKRITFLRPSLPESIERLTMTGVVVAGACVDILLERHAADVAVSVMKREGEIEVVSIT